MNTLIRLFVGAFTPALFFTMSGLAEARGASVETPKGAGTATPPSAITVTVDPRVELVAVAQHLSGYAQRFKGRINDLDHPYLNELRQHFAAFKEHPSIRQFAGAGLGGSAPIDVAVNLSDPDAVVLRGEIDRTDLTPDKVNAYVECLRGFAADAGFAAFFASQRAHHDAIVADFTRIADPQAVAARVENYCGTRPDRYTIVLAPLLGRTWFGARGTAADGTRTFYAVLCPGRVVEGQLVFGQPDLLAEHISHEFGHCFINPLVDQHWPELANYAPLMEKIEYRQAGNYGRDWKVCVYEHLVRAMTARLVLQQKGAEAYAQLIASDKAKGFLFVEDLCRALEAYETNRDRFPALDSFFPELVRVFARLHETAAEKT